MHRAELRLDILINNACVTLRHQSSNLLARNKTFSGIMSPPHEMLTEDGYDLTFGTNVLGHWYLTKLLTPALLKATTLSQEARIVNLSSSGAYLIRGIDFDSLRDGQARRQMSGQDLYNQSKLVSKHVSAAPSALEPHFPFS
jgi:NAD(P)-dependent dehydrogenase (short-subunit alcohol dehydrogenase family)